MRTRKADPSRLAELRESRWWTQAKLSEESGVSVPTIIAIEKGRNPHPQNQTLFALARALGVNPVELLEPRPPNGNPNGNLRHHPQENPPLYGTG